MRSIEGQPILTAAQMRAAEDSAIASGATIWSLMGRAGAGVAETVHRLAAGADVLVLCGPGNNGGDGYVAAARLAAAGLPVRVAALGESRTEAAQRARAYWSGPIEMLADAVPAAILVDALFGIGLSRGIDAAAKLRALATQARLTIAIDVPSGAATDDGTLLSDAPWCDVTLALAALKPAHVLQPAAARCGKVIVVDIGVRSSEAAAHVVGVPVLHDPAAADHKYTRGMVAVIAGAMPGAAVLAATAAARSGAGYVLLLGSATDRVPHAIVRRRYDPATLADQRIGAVLIGPGLGRDDRARDRLAAALASSRPLVLDGDALHLLTPADIVRRRAPTVLTPHGGEFAALFGDRPGSKIDRARSAAAGSGATVVFKGADTVIAHPGGQVRVAEPASPWLSTAGTGDVLAGAIAALLASGGDPFQAACDGVWLHADAARRCGASFIADDLAFALTAARASL